MHRLRNIRLATFSSNRQSSKTRGLHYIRKSIKFLASSFNPRNRPCGSTHWRTPTSSLGGRPQASRHVVIIDNSASILEIASVAELDLEAGGHAVEGFAVDAEDFGGALAVVAGGVQDEEDVAALDLV